MTLKSGNYCHVDTQWPRCRNKQTGLNELKNHELYLCPLGKCLCPGGLGGEVELRSAWFTTSLIAGLSLAVSELSDIPLAQTLYILAHTEPRRFLSKAPNWSSPKPRALIKSCHFCGMLARDQTALISIPDLPFASSETLGKCILSTPVSLCVTWRWYLLGGWLWGLNGIISYHWLTYQSAQHIRSPQWRPAVNTSLGEMSSRKGP